MICKIHSVSNFSDPVNYVFSPEKDPIYLGGNLIGETPEEIMIEFKAVAKRNSLTEKPCKHIALGFAPEDDLTPIEKAKIAKEVIFKLGYKNNDYLIVEHGRNDPTHDHEHNHDHIHIIVNAIDNDTSYKVKDSYERYKAVEVCREIEEARGLRQLNHLDHSPNTEIQSISQKHRQRIKREQAEYNSGKREQVSEPEYRAVIQNAINQASADHPSLPIFLDRLNKKEIRPHAYISNQGRRRISYSYRGYTFRGSKLNNASFPRLIEKRGIKFDSNKDIPLMEKAAKGELSGLVDDAELEKTEQKDIDQTKDNADHQEPVVKKKDKDQKQLEIKPKQQELEL